MPLIYKLNLILLISLMPIITACGGFFLQTHKKSQSAVAKTVEIKKPEIKMIKGYINSLKFTDNGWQYKIIGIDTSNNKLPNVTAYSKKIYYNEKDLVYAIINGDKISEMYLINKANNRSNNIKKNTHINKKAILPLPKNENISF